MSARSIDWGALPYGRLPDDDIARRLGVTRAAVCKHRNALGIAPFAGTGRTMREPLTALERADLEALEHGLTTLLDSERPHLAIAAAAAVARTPEWRVETRRARGAGLQPGRATAFRFRAPGRRTFTAWLTPREARDWVLQAGWADQASARIEALRAAPQQGEEASA